MKKICTYLCFVFSPSLTRCGCAYRHPAQPVTAPATCQSEAQKVTVSLCTKHWAGDSCVTRAAAAVWQTVACWQVLGNATSPSPVSSAKTAAEVGKKHKLRVNAPLAPTWVSEVRGPSCYSSSFYRQLGESRKPLLDAVFRRSSTGLSLTFPGCSYQPKSMRQPIHCGTRLWF